MALWRAFPPSRVVGVVMVGERERERVSESDFSMQYTIRCFSFLPYLLFAFQTYTRVCVRLHFHARFLVSVIVSVSCSLPSRQAKKIVGVEKDSFFIPTPLDE